VSESEVNCYLTSTYSAAAGQITSDVCERLSGGRLRIFIPLCNNLRNGFI